MKRSLIATALGGTVLAAALLAAVPVVAEPGGPGHHREGRGAHFSGWGGPGMAGRFDRFCEGRDARLAGLLASTEVRLGITEAQKADWTRFTESMKQAGSAFDDVCASMAESRNAGAGPEGQPQAGAPEGGKAEARPRPSLPERLARMEAIAGAGAEALERARPAVEQMYAALTPEQREIADGMMARGHHRR